MKKKTADMVNINIAVPRSQIAIIDAFAKSLNINRSVLFRYSLHNLATSFSFNLFNSEQMASGFPGHQAVSEESHIGRNNFIFDGKNVDIIVKDAAMRGYKPQNIKFIVSKYESLLDRFNLDSDKTSVALLNAYKNNKSKWERIARSKTKIAYDNIDLVAVDNINFSRTGDDEDNVITIRASVASYFDHRAIVDVFSSLSESERGLYLKSNGSRYFGRLTAVSVAVITNDEKIIFPQRSVNVASDPGRITCGINEGIRYGDIESARIGKTSIPHWAAIRGLSEEFGVDLPENLYGKVTLFSTVVHARYFEWYFLGVVDLRGCGSEYNSDKLDRNMRVGRAKDRFESDGIFITGFNRPDVERFLSNNIYNLTAYGISTAMQSLDFLGL